MRSSSRPKIRRRSPAPALLLLALAGACTKSDPLAGSPPPADADEPDTHAQVAPSTSTSKPPTSEPRLELEAEFHRTRVAAGPGFWVLGMLRNPHPHALTDVRAQVRLLDAEGKPLAVFESPQPGGVAVDGVAPLLVHVAAPVEHEQLELSASARASERAPEPPPITVEHDPPQRAELGGWFILGQVTNTGAQPITGARLEVRGFDAEDHLLGVDWFELEPLPPGVAQPFDLAELRYEQTPARFEIEPRGP